MKGMGKEEGWGVEVGERTLSQAVTEDIVSGCH